MILPYHNIATAAAISQAGVCASQPVAKAPGQDQPLFLCASGVVSSVHRPSRLARFIGAVLSPIAGPTLSRNGAGN